MSKQIRERSRGEGKGILEEKKETHSLESLYTIGAEGWEPGK